MAKLQDCQFFEIKIDGKILAGLSEEEKYKGWIEGFMAPGLQSISGPDGIYFDPIRLTLTMCDGTRELYEKFVKRGYQDLTITVVHRGSSQLNGDYEIQRTVFSDCKFQSFDFEPRDQNMFANVSLTFVGGVELTFNIPNAQGKGIDKIGPIKYNIPQKKLM
jgi:hypothetical protein